MSRRDQTAKAQREIRSWKKHFPHLLLEWHELKSAERSFKEARDRLRVAKAKWKALGGESDAVREGK